MTKLLTTTEVRGILRISRTTLYRMMKRGELPQIRIGPKRIRFKPEDIEELINGAINKTSKV